VVSTLEPRKNGRFLIRWFRETQALAPEMELWWVGPKGWLLDLGGAARSRRKHARNIRFLGMVEDRRLCRLYQQAACTIYPSLYEGFGLPVLDSLRHGAPVICSFNSSLQEFAGPGVHYFDPCDPASLDRACREALEILGSGTVRDDLDERFSWTRLADCVLDMCSETVSQ
jgi:glycosyltransferase involved in cell wall biosynthesis